MLKLENISVGYKLKPCLKNINVSFLSQKHTAVIGGANSGKTTFLKVAAGILKPICGQVFFDNLPITEYSRRELLRNICYVPQDHFKTKAAILDFLLLSRRPFSLEKATSEDMDVVSSAINALELTPYLNLPLSDLSPLVLQKVYLASALVQGSSYILIDEPSAFLSKGEKQEIIHIINKIKALGKTVIIAETDISFAEKCCSETLLLSGNSLLTTAKKELQPYQSSIYM